MTASASGDPGLDRLGPLAPIDRAFADLIGRLGGDPWTVLSAALVSRERGRGHACLDLDAWSGRRLAAEVANAPRGPSIAEWRRHLEASEWVAVAPSPGDPVRPLVLDSADRLYLWRYWAAEQRLARRIHRILATPLPDLDLDALAPHFQRLFPPPDDGTIDWQAMAAVAALRSPFCLVSGGPGTGKTTTVSRLLALLDAAQPGLRIALTAPTGKAATRLEESLGSQLTALRAADGESAAESLPTSASTLHRLLGYHPRDDRFRHRAENPWILDLLMIDEASMVDLLLIDAALAALPDEGRVILLGDRDQLASVDAGFVFGDLCRAAGLGERDPVLAPEVRALYERLTGRRLLDELPTPRLAHDALAGIGTELRISYRFRHRPGIGALADAIRHRQPRRAAEVLDDPQAAEVGRAAHPTDDDLDALEPVLAAVDRVLDAASPSDALDRLGEFRVLCATRVGRWGTRRVNRLVEHYLERRGHNATEVFYRGRPILVEANDYQVRLWNGDLGICWPDDDGLWVFFADDRPGELRRLPLAKIPPHATAWAMTVHKSQGSELDHVLLILPESADMGRDLLSRELLYTAVTRARDRVDVVATDEILETTIRRSARRASGLVDALSQPRDEIGSRM